MNVLILGSGAREHALGYSLSKSPNVHKIFACPGNGGLGQFAQCFPFKDNRELVSFAKEQIQLALVGSSKFIAMGTVDALTNAGIPVIAPAADAGRIETSKAFASSFIASHNIPAPITQIVTNRMEAKQFIEENPWVGVVKADRFAAGTGVALVNSKDEALEAADKFLKVHGPPILLQELEPRLQKGV